MKLLSVSVLCLLAPLAVGQTGASVTISDGNVTFTQGALPTASSNLWPVASLQAQPLPSVGRLASLWWYYRVAGDAQETTFRDDVAPGAASRGVTGPTVVTDWPDVGGRGLFAASLVETVVSTGADRGYVQATMQLTNLTASSLTLDLFSLADLQAGGPGGSAGDLAWGGPRSQYVEVLAGASTGVEYYCANADLAQVDDFAAATPGVLPSLLSDGSADDLSGWSGASGPGDHVGAYQWHRRLPAGGSETFRVYVAITSQRPQQQLYGNGGAGSAGLPLISTSERALLDPSGAEPRGYEVLLRDALPFSFAVIATSSAAAALVLPGLEVYVDPATLVTTVVSTDDFGNAVMPIALPNNPALNGVAVFHQGFVLDGGAANGLLSWTLGLEQTIGSW